MAEDKDFIINKLELSEATLIDKLLGFCQYIQKEKAKGKIPFIITGVGISPKVPNVTKMMSQLCEHCRQLKEMTGM